MIEEISRANEHSGRTKEPVERSRLENFRRFNEQGGKFRLAIINACNLSCFFCHNEAMKSSAQNELSTEDFIEIANAYAGLGGHQINLTGGEPLAHPDLPLIIESIVRRESRLVVNTNGLLYKRLTSRPRIEALDTLLVSLHTVDNDVFKKDLGGRDVHEVQRGILALRDHGYRVKLNLSLGPHNASGFEAVLNWCVENELDLKVIALVRPTEAPGFYGGDWVDPDSAMQSIQHVAQLFSQHEQLGGAITTFHGPASTIELKNIARARLRTDFCRGCNVSGLCGEGIYGLRIGVDGISKPCLLRFERHRKLDRSVSWEEQILSTIDEMMGDPANAKFYSGAPA